jgi:hypothetical protein
VKDVRSIGLKPPPEDAYEIVELTEPLPASSSVLGSILQMSDTTALERVRDPLFQAFVATGFFRPR